MPRISRIKKRKLKTVAPFVKHGRLVLHIPYRYIRLLATVTVIYHICTLGFNLEMFNIAYHMKGHIGVYLNMILENGYTMVYVLCISAFMGIALNIFIAVVCLRIFASTGKVFYWLLFVCMVLATIFMLFILILIFYMFGYAFAIKKEGMAFLYSLLNNYSTDGLTKTRIDIMQIELQCCGVRNYSDWFGVAWLDTNFVKPNEDGVKLIGETPFSCCNIRTIFPCVHHGVESGATDYYYEINANFSLNIDGCWRMMEKRKNQSGLKVAGYLLLQFILVLIGYIPLRFLQTASNEKHGFPLENYNYTGWFWGCYVGDKNKKNSHTTSHHTTSTTHHSISHH